MVIRATSGNCDKMISGSIRGTWDYVSILEISGQGFMTVGHSTSLLIRMIIPSSPRLIGALDKDARVCATSIYHRAFDGIGLMS